MRAYKFLCVLMLLGLWACSDEPGSSPADAAGDAVSPLDTTEGADTSDADGPSTGLEVAGEVDGYADPAEVVELPSGTFEVITYNVAGLPEGISSSHPEVNIPLISPLLDTYDLVLVQEDFYYHEQLVAEVTLPYLSTPLVEEPAFGNMGDGLNRMTVFAFDELVRTPWPGCNGALDCASDCLATKGFSYARMELDEGVYLDVYNLHGEAGGCPEDEELREEGYAMLAEEILARSEGMALIVAGDSNLHDDDDIDIAVLAALQETAGLSRACEVVDCATQTIDKILYRSSPTLLLTPTDWRQPGEFVTDEGEPLSDHTPSAATFAWEQLAP